MIYGRAIGECGKEKIFANYSDMELRLGNIDRCRKIYAKSARAEGVLDGVGTPRSIES